MELNNFKIGDKVVFTGTLVNFKLNDIYTISGFSTVDYFIDEVDPNFGKECVHFLNHKYGCFLVDLFKQFTKIEDIRQDKINKIIK
jgi:hypothetical protein